MQSRVELGSQVRALLSTLREQGYKISVQGELLRVEPSNLTAENVSFIQEHYELVHTIVSAEQCLRNEGNKLCQLKQLCPAIWEPASLKDGRTCLIWGITPRGVIVMPEDMHALITVDVSDIQQITTN